MGFRARIASLFIFATVLTAPLSANAYYDQRFSLGVGFAKLANSSQVDFEVGGEYEYRFAPILGAGLSGNYIFSNPSITLVGAPEVYLHPLGGDWFLSAAPLFEFTSGTTYTGVRLGTRIPLPLGVLTLIPSFGIDFIHGGQNLLFGIGIQI